MVQRHRGVEADRADRHAAAQLGALDARQADHRLRQARPDHLRPDLLVSARHGRELRAGFTREARLEALARSGARSAVRPGALLPVAPLLGLRRRLHHRPDDALDRRRPLVHERRGAAVGGHSGTQLQHQAVGGARHGQRDARVPEELHWRPTSAPTSAGWTMAGSSSAAIEAR